jgi:hypothetical protein
MSPPQVFVRPPGFHLADSQLGDDVRCPTDCFGLVRSEMYLEGSISRLYHAPGEAADDLQALRVDVHQPKLAEREAVTAGKKAID